MNGSVRDYVRAPYDDRQTPSEVAYFQPEITATGYSLPCCSNSADQRRAQFMTSCRSSRTDELMCKRGPSTASRTLLLQSR